MYYGTAQSTGYEYRSLPFSTTVCDLCVLGCSLVAIIPAGEFLRLHFLPSIPHGIEQGPSGSRTPGCHFGPPVISMRPNSKPSGKQKKKIAMCVLLPLTAISSTATRIGTIGPYLSHWMV